MREARIANGWTQTELGGRSDVSRPTIARAEAGQDISTATLAKIARALGLTVGLEARRD
ncbi:XRE family transcriptional regulator [Rhodococcus erythropolis]|nr:XRE family transcriptional regulator [Rhodococcus erythropolis]